MVVIPDEERQGQEEDVEVLLFIVLSGLFFIGHGEVSKRDEIFQAIHPQILIEDLVIGIRSDAVEIVFQRSCPRCHHQNEIILIQLMRKENNILLLDVLINEEDQLRRNGSFLLVHYSLFKRKEKLVVEDGLDVDVLVEAHYWQDVVGIFSDARMFLDG